MSKKNEKVENEVVTENAEVTSKEKEQEVNNEEVKSEETTEKVENEEKLVANTDFFDKYTNEKYIKGTEFIVADVKETKKIGEKQFKISKARAEEIKAKGYIE